ncbi:hypothetical protein GCM10009819_30090 [Agromyces tropicus]|uniref:DUF2550 family protein n=1 Tax=Agromyces tropicus TaxID=555371 RepID=A0ABN2URZ0_9MICO
MGMLGRTLVALLTAVGIAAAVAAAIVVIGFRRQDPRVLRPLVRWQRRSLNPRALETAGRPGDQHSIIRHVGRTSGREYATPIGAVRVAGGFEIMLPYGSEAH